MKYRYYLRRHFIFEGPIFNYIMLNPSTATEEINDPTVERCQKRAMGLGAGGMIITNLFAWRSTDPRALKNLEDPIGPMNDYFIKLAVDLSHKVICGWGKDGDILKRGKQVKDILTSSELWCLGVNLNGTPKHPLYLGYDIELERYE